MAKKLDAFLYVCLFVAIYWFCDAVAGSFFPLVNTFRLFFSGERTFSYLLSYFGECLERGSRGAAEMAIASLLTLVLIWIVFVIRKKRFLSVFKTKRLYVKDVAGAIFIAFGLQTISSLVMFIPFPQKLFEIYERHMALAVSGSTLTVFIMSGFIAPVFEELFFRGVVYDEFSRGGGFWFSNIMQSLVFAVLHLNAVQGIYAFFVGIMLGSAMKLSKSIYIPIIIHIVFNITSLIFGGFITSVSGDAYFIICGIFSLVLGFLLFKRK